MKTYLDCFPCFLKQALYASRKAKVSVKIQKEILDKVAGMLPTLSFKSPPPEVAKVIYEVVNKVSGVKDPFLKDKKRSNELALEIYDKLEEKISLADDKILVGVELAIAGNIIDYGVKNTINVDDELEKILNEEKKLIKEGQKLVFDFKKFKKVLKKSNSILYLADNAGEVVFDRLLIEQIKNIDPNKDIIYAVKEKPVINDALEEDAVFCGIDQSARIISSGSDAPGTVLSLCSKDFLSIYRKADMVISKGQGNFEALSKPKRPVFFLFMAKCPVVARHVGCEVGDINLIYSEVTNKR